METGQDKRKDRVTRKQDKVKGRQNKREDRVTKEQKQIGHYNLLLP